MECETKNKDVQNDAIADDSLARKLGFFSIAIWSTAFIFTKICMESFSANALAFLRFLFAAIFFIVIIFVKKTPLPKLKDLPLFLCTGFFGYAFYTCVFNIGTVMISVSTNSIMIATSPIFAAIWSSIFLKEKLKKLCYAAIGVMFLGILIITFGDGFTFNIGCFYIILCAISFSINNVILRKLTKTYNSFDAMAYSIIIGALMLCIFIPETIPQIKPGCGKALLFCAFLGLGSSGISQVTWSKGISVASKTSVVANFMFVTPFLTTILGLVMIKEVPSVNTIIGGATIFVGLMLFNVINSGKNLNTFSLQNIKAAIKKI